jgi:selenocysteine lyase/cysteine desulfurase
MCREHEVKLVVDGVQAAGIIAMPLRDLGADVVSIGGHKGLFGLTGSGIVYCRDALVDALRTPFIRQPTPSSSASERGHANSQFDYVRVAHRFEGGNPNFLGVRVLQKGAEFLQSIGLQHIENRVRTLSDLCLKLLRTSGFKTETPELWEERAHIVNVLVPDAAGVMERLRDRHRIVTNVKDNALRVSMSFFNTEDDMEKAVWAIAKETEKASAAA